jgi:aryl-alcohol dehydrogenase-like predicted oxidoreductase
MTDPGIAGNRLALGSRVGLGTAPLGSSPGWQLWWGVQDEAAAVATVRAALDAGITWIDTAPFYGWGRAEELVGRAVRGRREEVLLFTKCCTVPDGRGGAVEDGRPAVVRADLEASLRRLGTDHVDVLQIHDPDPTVPVEETWGELQRLIAEGKARHGGLSNHPVELMDRAEAIGQVTVVQHQYSLLWHQPQRDGVLDWCARRQVPFLAWSPLASGFLVDGFDLDGLDARDFRHRMSWALEPWRKALAGLVTELTAAGAPRGLSSQQLALGWVLRRPGTYAIVGARTPSEVAALDSVAAPLTGQELAAIQAALARLPVEDLQL